MTMPSLCLYLLGWLCYQIISSCFRYYHQMRDKNLIQPIEDLIADSCSKCKFEEAHKYYRRLFDLEKSLALNYVNGVNKLPREQIFAHTATLLY
jgi:hypothetical protein